MKKAITLIVFFLFSCNSSNLDCNTYYLIRHAEKVRLNPDDKDPELNEAGKERALVWKEYFSDLEIDKIFSTDYYEYARSTASISIYRNCRSRGNETCI